MHVLLLEKCHNLLQRGSEDLEKQVISHVETWRIKVTFHCGDRKAGASDSISSPHRFLSEF
jgi:hypothetical protein